jgi:acyl-CoA thioesterase-1
MNPLVLYFASGESLYSGAAILLLAIAVSPLVKRRLHRLLRNIAALSGLALIVMASPPFPVFIDIGFLAVFVLWFSTVHRDVRTPVRAMRRTSAAAVLAGFLLVVCGVELRHRRAPTTTGLPGDHLVVIGDSISAGIDPRVPSWPMVMQEMTGVSVRSLALPGADLVEALTLTTELTPEDRVVLIEIGGNELLSGVPSREFARRLEAVLKRIVLRDRVVAMFELPLLPLWTSYGRAQRRLASKYGVFLIPKRDFAAVISGRNSTLDGLHLSELGTRRISSLVARVLSPVLKATCESVRSNHG